MKGVLLAGGTGSRLMPLTKLTNKHLLPVYNKAMIYYPLFTLKSAGVSDVLIIAGKDHSGSFIEMLGSGSELGLNLSYEMQDEAGGIAQALGLAEDFANGEKIVVILGDNIFESNISDALINFDNQENGGRVFLKSVENPSAYGVAEMHGNSLKNIIEKPKNPPSNLAVTGCYMYDSQVFDVIKTLKPSQRNELEITDVNNFYLNQGTLKHSVLDGFWGDCGESFDNLMNISKLVKHSHLADVWMDVLG